MTLSIIVPSYFKSEILKWFFWSLSKQTISYTNEIIILNDGIEDNTKAVCNKYRGKLNIRYLFTGKRNENKLQWRIPGFATNIGVNRSNGHIIILTQPDIFLLDNTIDDMVKPILENKNKIIITKGKDDNINFLTALRARETNLIILEQNYNKQLTELNTKMPFFMAMSKEKYLHIGGYDEDFIGYCFDDNDFVDKLEEDNSEIIKINKRIIHLYHPRNAKYRKGLENRNELWEYNRKIYLKKKQKRLSNSVVLKPKIFDIQIKTKEPLKVITKPINKEITIGDRTKWHLEKIPKIAHFYWGETQLPFLRYLTIYSFHKHNPDWEIRFYYPKHRHHNIEWNTNEHRFDFTGKNYYSKLKKLPIKLIEVDFELLGFRNDISEVYKANYLEYCLLSLVGGMFSDTDILYFNSMNTISINNIDNKQIDNVFSILWHGHTMGFLMASPNNDIYNYILKKISIYLNKLKNNYQCIGTLMLDRELGKSIREINQRFPNLIIKNLEVEALYAYDISKIKEVFEIKNGTLFKNHSIGLHWYGGHQLSMEYLNKINKLEDANSDKIIDQIIRKSSKPKCTNLTIHSVIKNEALVYYSIKSVYDYADKILLYDTGSTDQHTIEDIKRLLKEDKDNKIIFKQIPLDFDESQWTYNKVNKFAEKHKGKMSVGKVRQMQLDDTDTEYCMIVDGDEIHYKSTMERIITEILPNLNENIVGVNLPLIWFYDMEYNFKVPGLENTGRIWRVNQVKMNKQSPNEYHCFKDSGVPVKITDKEYLIYKDIQAYAHFETYLKPWRREIHRSQLTKFENKLPEVMLENDYFLNRYKDKLEKGKDNESFCRIY